MRLLYLLLIFLQVHLHINSFSTDLQRLQTSIREDTRVETELSEITFDNVSSDQDENNFICYLQHVVPQPNTDPLIGPFEVRTVPRFGLTEFSVVYDPENGFPLNPLIQSAYQTRVCCYDATLTSDPPVCTPFFISVSKNTPPTISGVSEVTIDSELNSGGTVVQLVPADADNDPVTFSITSDPADARRFFAVDSSGLVTTTVNGKSIPYAKMTLNIFASDGKDTTSFPVTVNVNSVNHRPNILQLPLNVTIKENAAKETLITNFNFADEDGFTAPITPVCTVNPREESFKFAFDSNRNAYRLSNISDQPLDFESNNFYNISCVISDGFLDSVGETIGIYVENVNEAPVFAKSQHTCVLFESPAGESFCDVRFTATDPDNDAVTISLAGDFNNRFALTDNNRRLTFAVDYDLESVAFPSSVILNVVATDPFGATGTTTLNIAVTDINDNDPVFTTEITTIPVEYATGIGRIGAFTATDTDQGSNGDLEYELVNIFPPDAATHFNLFNNGELHYLSQFPDTLARTTALIVAKATDKGSPRRSATGTIALTFGTTTTTSTTTMTTTTMTTTTTTTTTTAPPTTTPFDFWARPENVAMFAILMTLLALALLAALLFCLRYCLTGACCGGPPIFSVFRRFCGQCCTGCCEPGACSGFVERCRGCDCDCDCCRPPKVRPQVVQSIDYNEDFWRKSDHYESGKPFHT
ncbi:hypothetical protein SNE40_021557 [Patella caerulea]|uniref:Cadherin domain-containing protein n=1 Tax=Patella caerulea TaxID=87958 RepID=A0AAN8G868_PATCE